MALGQNNYKKNIMKIVDRINEKNPYYLVIGVLVLVLVLDYFFIMQFQLKALRTLGPKVMQTKSDIDLYERNKGRVQKYKKDIEDLDRKLKGLQDRIKDTQDIPVILEDISKTANKHNIFLEQMLPNTDFGDSVLKNEEGKYFLLPINIDASGSYHNFGKFLNELEDHGALMKVNEMRLLSNASNLKQHMLRLKIEAVIFEARRNK